jgi:hypothetical protein
MTSAEIKRAALVMGFGWGRANDDVATFVERRNALERFNLILSQEAVVAPLSERKLASLPMHGHHHAVYVDTLDAAAFGLLKLKDLFGDADQVVVEVIAHERQILRAHEATELAIRCLARRPSVGEFLKRVTVPRLEPITAMRTNEWSGKNAKHFWTCNPLVYWLFDTIPIALRFHSKKKQYQQDPEFIYRKLSEINKELQDRGVRWQCSELP